MGKFTFDTLEEIKTKITELGLNLACSTNTSNLFEPLKISFNSTKFWVPNRFVIHPMEGFDATKEGSPTDLTYKRYERYGTSGTGIVWFEAVSVLNEGKSNPHQLYLNNHNKQKFKDLLTSFHKGRIYLQKHIQNFSKSPFGEPLKILQLTHSGRYSRPKVHRIPLCATKNHILDKAMNIDPEKGIIVSDEYLENLQDAYYHAIQLAEEIGFDGVDIKSCHGYLVSELLGAYTRENSKFGGESFKNRQRFLLDIIKKATREFPKLLITLRLNLFDSLPYPYGMGTKKINSKGIPISIDLTELHALIARLESYGIHTVSFSAGNPYFKPYISRPFVQNAFNAKEPPEPALKSIARIIDCLREISEHHPKLVRISTAFSWFRQYLPFFAAGEINRNSFDCIGYGRMAFAYPDFPIDLYKTGKLNPKMVCITCSKCTELMRMGSATGCVVRNDIYTAIYRREYSKYIGRNSN
ncbi:MAG: hypothetical protein JW776_06610 [Candidatus Lokiarchaeota archaeon]|nr:hypothetical protein [Candidatus Lokiarchaeota archaeon]